MKFLVDAHLPPSLCILLQAAGHDAIHTSHLTAQNRTPDEALNELSLKKQRAVVTERFGLLSFASTSRKAVEAAAHPHRQHSHPRSQTAV